MSSAAEVLAKLEESGLLLVQDKSLPNVVRLITGETLKGSWWSHAKAQQIFQVLSELADHRDVLFAKLVGGKVTLIHRRLWRAFLSVAISREPWQIASLSDAARKLLAAIERSSAPVRCRGKDLKELELRLIVHSDEVHTEEGRHEMVAETWEQWARRKGVKPLASVDGGRRKLEEAARAIAAPLSSLPWARKV